MEKHILLGNLIEKQAVSVIQMYFTQRIIDEVSAYCIQDWKDLSYQQIMSTLQFLYIPLNLHLFQSLVLAYRVEGNESFLEFSSRTYRHLKLCSRMKEPEERADYIERNRVAILKQNVPTQILDIIIKKEQIFRPFNSREIVDHVVSQYHVKESNIKEVDQYRVLNMTVSEKPKEKMEKVENPFKQFATPTKSLEHKPDNRSEKKEKRITYSSILKEWDLKGRRCLYCLSLKHQTSKCTLYNTKFAHTAPKDGMCVEEKAGKRIPMGFHQKSQCLHKGTGEFKQYKHGN